MTRSDAFPRRPVPWRAARALAAVVALSLAAASLLEYRAWRRQRQTLLQDLSRGGAAERAPQVMQDVMREPDPVAAALRTARGLLADELDRGWQAELGPTELAIAQQDGLHKLARAREIAAQSLARRPASWQAAEVLGAARYLDAVRRHLPMEPARREHWRRPLLAARALGPGQAEPLRFLAAATLSEWPRLSPTERDEALGLLRDAFADAETFDLLATSWLRVAPSRSTAFGAVPPQPRAWRTVERFYAERADWGPFAEAHARGREVLLQRLREQLEQAEKRLRGGDRRRARWFALEIVDKAPPSRSFQPLLARALEILPAGPLGEVRARRMAEWHAWSRDLCLLGECPFSPAVLARMAGLARLTEAADLAAAAEMSGDGRGAELHRRGVEILGSPWAPYHLLRARRLAGAGEIAAARRSLERVHTDWRSRAAYLEAVALLAGETRPGSPPPSRPRRLAWPPEAWIPQGRPLLELYGAAACQQIEIEILGVAPRGSALDVYWDGDLAGTYPLAAGQPVRLPLPVTPTSLHRLEVEPFVHPRLRPGRVWLRRCAS